MATNPLRIGIVGDYKADFPPHPASNAAIQHSAQRLGLNVMIEWLPTKALAGPEWQKRLEPLAGLLIAPGSPYQSMEGVLNAIRWAREGKKRPLIGTCGGFQHIVIEYARNVLGVADAQHAEYDPDAPNLFISPLACSLAGREFSIAITPDSLAFQAYQSLSTVERYYCNFGINPAFRQELEGGGLRTMGIETGEELTRGEPRILELETRRHPFFVATLFVPQMRSTAHAPHPLLNAFLRACR